MLARSVCLRRRLVAWLARHVPLFRRSVRAEPPRLVEDPAMVDAELAQVRDLAVGTGRWEPAADLLAGTAGGDWDRRGAVANALAAAAIQPAPWLDAWLTARPNDPGAHLIAAWATVQRAWEARGHGRASATGESAFDAFFRILEQALPLAHYAVRTAPEDPTPWVVLTWLSIGRQDGREVLDDHWGELLHRDPQNRLGHIARLQCLARKWWGSHEEMYAFARSVTAPQWAPVVPLQAHAEYALDERDEGEAGALIGFWQRSDVAADLDAGHAWATTTRPEHAYAFHDLTVVGYTVAQAERWPQAAQVFRLLGPRAYEYPWYYHANAAQTFAKTYEKALSAG